MLSYLTRSLRRLAAAFKSRSRKLGFDEGGLSFISSNAVSRQPPCCLPSFCNFLLGVPWPVCGGLELALLMLLTETTNRSTLT
jgi:hypothetical protein